MAYQRRQQSHSSAQVDEGQKYFICLDYDPFKGITDQMFLVMTTGTEARGNWYGGREIQINGQAYILSTKQDRKPDGLSVYKILEVSKDRPALMLSDDDFD